MTGMIRRLGGSRRAPKRENRTKLRSVKLACGEPFFAKVLPKPGDFVYCARHREFTEVPR